MSIDIRVIPEWMNYKTTASGEYVFPYGCTVEYDVCGMDVLREECSGRFVAARYARRA